MDDAMNTKTPELIPCPWCGSTNLEQVGAYRHHHKVACVECGCAGPGGVDQAAAVEAWNTRHFGRTLTNEIGASAGERSHEAAQAVIDNEAASIKRDAENQG